MRQQLAVEPSAPLIGTLADPEPPDTSAFLRANPGAQALLRELSEGSEVVVVEPIDTEPVAYTLNIGQLLGAEADALKSRERQLRELRALASCRLSDLKPDQVRRILEAIALATTR